MRTAVASIAFSVAVASLTGCAVTTGDGDAYDVTLQSDGKTDEISGLRVRWELGERHDWFAENNPELAVTVGRRGGTLMLLDADVAEIKAVKPDGTVNYTPSDTLTIGIETAATNVELGFALADGTQLAEGRLVPIACGGTQMFKSLAFDFAASELVVDGSKRVAFASCGITLDAKDQPAFRATSFALLGVPIRTLDGSQFAGRYEYKHTVAVR